MNIQPVDVFVRAGFLQQVTDQFRAVTTWTTSPDKLAELKTALGNKQPAYPYVFLTQQSLSPNKESYNPRRLARYGVPVRFSDDQRLAYNARLIPANYEVELTFITNDYDRSVHSVNGFARRWAFAQRNGYLNYRVNYGLTALDVNVMLTDTLSLPQRENPADSESIYQVVANVTIHGYVSEPELAERQRILQIEPTFEVSEAKEGTSHFYPFPKN